MGLIKEQSKTKSDTEHTNKSVQQSDSSSSDGLHHVYCLHFDQTTVPSEIRDELFQQINEIREYGTELPGDTDQIIFYIGETYRKSERMREHRTEPHNKNHKSWAYSSREMIRCLDSHKIKWDYKILKSFPKGSHVDDFEHHFFCQFADLNHPLTNMSTTLDSPSVPRLAKAESIEEYRQIKDNIIEEKKAAKKRKRTQKRKQKRKIKNRRDQKLHWHEIPNPNQRAELNEIISDHILELASLETNPVKQRDLIAISDHIDDHLWLRRCLPANSITATQLKKFVMDALNDDLTIEKSSDPTAGMRAHELRKHHGC